MAKAKTAGRPALARNQLRAHVLKVQVRTSDLRKIRRAARAADLSVSTWARGVLLTATEEG